MDYSENISGTPKFEPQDAHFAEKQLTLHCTVSYGEEKEYLYHLSNDLTHDAHHTSAVVEHMLTIYPTDSKMFRFK